MLSRALISCLLAATLAGCGGGASLFSPATGTVTGHVQIRACGGAYRIDLKPGSYRVHATEEGSTRQGFAGFSGPTTVTVVAGKTVTADFTYTIQLL
jgi:hypothetical protein